MGLFKPKKPAHILSIYFGVPGAGKTTFAAYLAKHDLKRGFNVWSNVPITGTYKLSPVEDIGKHMICDGRVIIDCLLYTSIDVRGEITDGKISVSGRAVLKMCDVLAETLTVISGAELEAPEAEEPRPSVIVYRVREEDSLWGICKRFRSDCEGLKIANGIDGKELLEPGCILLIPKG